jgi:hypothetical protein
MDSHDHVFDPESHGVPLDGMTKSCARRFPSQDTRF